MCPSPRFLLFTVYIYAPYYVAFLFLCRDKKPVACFFWFFFCLTKCIYINAGAQFCSLCLVRGIPMEERRPSCFGPGPLWVDPSHRHSCSADDNEVPPLPPRPGAIYTPTEPLSQFVI